MIASYSLTPKQQARVTFRAALFVSRGTDADRAAELAERLTERDAGLDDRTLCLECKHLRSRSSCTRTGLYPLPEMLQRCPSFGWMTPASKNS